MLVHSIMAGAAIFALLGIFIEIEETFSNFINVVFYSSIAFNLLILAVEMLTAHPTADSKKVVKMIVSGQFSVPFWLGTLTIGNLIPLILISLGGSVLFAASGVLVLIGVYITEHIWVRAPQLIPLS